MDTVTAVSGSSPAYVYVYKAMADAAVLEGMPRIRHIGWQRRLYWGRKDGSNTGGRIPDTEDMVCCQVGHYWCRWQF